MNGTNQDLRRVFEALMAIQARLSENMEAFAKTHDMSLSHFLILSDIMYHPGTTMHELCQRAGLKKSSVSRIVDDMVSEKLVLRDIPEGDRRTVRLSLTESFSGSGFCSGDNLAYLLKGTGRFDDKARVSAMLGALADVYRLVTDETIPDKPL